VTILGPAARPILMCPAPGKLLNETGALRKAVSPRTEFFVGTLSWLLAVGLIAAIIGEAFR